MPQQNSNNNKSDAVTGMYMVPFGYPNVTAADSIVLANNRVYTTPFCLNTAIYVTKIAFELVSGAAGSCSVGIYNIDGTKLLIDGGVQSSVTPGVLSTTLGTPVLLTPGIYLAAQTATSASPTARAINFTNTILNAVTVRAGRAANSSSGGVLPATTGTITTLGVNPTIIVFSS